MTKITAVTLILVGMLLVAGIILDVTGNTDQGAQLIYVAVGVIVGSGATSVTVIQDVAQKLRNGDPPPDPKP